MTTIFESLHLIKIKYDTDCVQLASRAIHQDLKLGKNSSPICVIRDQWSLSFATTEKVVDQYVQQRIFKTYLEPDQ